MSEILNHEVLVFVAFFAGLTVGYAAWGGQNSP